MQSVDFYQTQFVLEKHRGFLSTYQFLIFALNTGEDILPHMPNVDRGHNGTITRKINSSHDNIEYASRFLNALAKLICTTHHIGEAVFEDGKNKLVLRYESGKVYCKQSTVCSNSINESQCELDVERIIETATVLFKGEMPPGDTAYLALLTNNPFLLASLAEHILTTSCEDPYRWPLDVVKQANYYDWNLKHLEMISNTPLIAWRKCCRAVYSRQLSSYFRHGFLPESPSKKSALFWEAAPVLLVEESVLHNEKKQIYYPLLYKIIANMAHLDCQFVDIKLNSTHGISAFRRGCEFLANHFKGNSLTFRDQDYLSDSTKISYVKVLTSLLNRNPHLTTIGFVQFAPIRDMFDDIIDLVNQHETVTTLKFIACDLHKNNMLYLIQNLAPHVTALHLGRNWNIDIALILSLLKSSTLTSLNLGKCYFSEERQTLILNALKKNRLLTSFYIGEWKTDELRKECELHLEYNKRQYFKMQLLSKAPRAKHVPQDVFAMIWGYLDHLVRRELNERIAGVTVASTT